MRHLRLREQLLNAVPTTTLGRRHLLRHSKYDTCSSTRHIDKTQRAYDESGVAALLHAGGHTHAAKQRIIMLPAPEMEHGKSLMPALRDRHTSREFSPKQLTPAVISNLLWAAFGVNRPHTGGRTAPSAHDWEEIDIYVSTVDGLYLYEAREHALQRRLAQDIRAHTGLQSYVADAPVNLIYVADLSRMATATEECNGHVQENPGSD